MYILALFISVFLLSGLHGEVRLGIDVFLGSDLPQILKGKKMGLLAHHVSRNCEGMATHEALIRDGKKRGYSLHAIFAPEHGFRGENWAEEKISDERYQDIPIYSLFGSTRRATDEMLSGLEILAIDLQDIGSRSYTYLSSACYFLEAAAKKGIPLIVFDRPNPLNGIVVDGPLVEDECRSFVGYPKVAYCHGMTIGEILQFHNAEEKLGAALYVVPMKGWRRSMSFADTGLTWIPTSPFFPEASTCLFYPMLSFIAELSLTSVGIGYTLPFKIIGAPWIDAEKFAKTLNEKKFPGVRFLPTYFRPFFGKFSHQTCQGILPVVEDPKTYLPVATQCLILGTLKILYPAQIKEALEHKKKHMIEKISGTKSLLPLLSKEGPIVWKLRGLHAKEKETFLEKRKKYLIPTYLN